jgi:hypothetical protein
MDYPTHIYFILSSMSYLQQYIPIANEFWNSHNIKSVFIKNVNKKSYTNVYNKKNIKKLEAVIKENSQSFDHIEFIDYKDNHNILKTKKIFFIVDGDFYGNRPKYLKMSLLHKINKNSYIVSLQENINFVWVYEHFIDHVNTCVFPNKALADQYQTLSNKNVYLGNAKFDEICTNKRQIYKKYNLSKKKKYCILLYPRLQLLKDNEIEPTKINNIINIFKSKRFSFIIKLRPKEKSTSSEHLKDFRGQKIVVSDDYPNQSIELMSICNLAIIFSSSCLDECIITKTPCIDLVIDKEYPDKLKYMSHKSVIRRIHKWYQVSNEDIEKQFKKLAKPGAPIFDQLKEEYLFDINTSSKKIVDYTLDNYQFGNDKIEDEIIDDVNDDIEIKEDVNELEIEDEISEDVNDDIEI